MDAIKKIYANENNQKVPYTGLQFVSPQEFGNYLRARVKDKLHDTIHREKIQVEIINALESTGFSNEELRSEIQKDFSSTIEVKNWLIGEFLTECILEDNYDVKFHYNHFRDAKNPNANQTGTDIVGFCQINNETYFVFGEVKTSQDTSSPPSVIYGRTGMQSQLKDLLSNSKTKQCLLQWLANKIVPLPKDNVFRQDYEKALVTYYKSKKKKFKLFGVLVRDTVPNELDIKAKAHEINNYIHMDTEAEFIAIYSGLKMENDAWINIVKEADCDK